MNKFFRALILLGASIVVSSAHSSWERNIDHIFLDSFADGAMTISAPDMVHVLWAYSARSRPGGDLQGFDVSGNVIYLIDLAAQPYAAATVRTITKIQESSSILAWGGGTLLKVSRNGGLLWRIEDRLITDDVIDAYEYADGSTAVALASRGDVNLHTSLMRISPTGKVIDLRRISGAYGSARARFDRNGRVMVLRDQFVLSRFDGRTMEETAHWSRIEANTRAIEAARDGGAVVLTSEAIVRIASNGDILWRTPFATPFTSSATEVRLIETASGNWLVYEIEYEQHVTGISPSGSINFSRPSNRAESSTLSEDGSVFVSETSAVRVLDSVSGTSIAVGSLPNATYARLAAVAGAMIAVTRNTGTTRVKPKVFGVTAAGAITWERSDLKFRADTRASRPDERPKCFGNGAIKTSEGFAAMVTSDRGSAVGGSFNSDSSYVVHISSDGQVLRTAPLPSGQCMPAIDSDLTRYELTHIGNSVRAVRSDNSLKWETVIPEYFWGELSTLAVGTSTVAATLMSTIVGLDTATGTLKWTVRATPVAAVAASSSGSMWAVTNLGLLRILAAGDYLVADSSIFALRTDTSAMLALSDGGLLLVDASGAILFAADGARRWTTPLSAVNATIGRIRRAVELANGDIAISGCDNDYRYGFQGFYARLSRAGALLHRHVITATSSSCIDALTELQNGNLVAAVHLDTSSDLRVYSPGGTELGRFTGVWKSAPDILVSDLLPHGSGVVTFGTAINTSTGIPTATLAKIDSVEPAATRLSVLSSMPLNSRYDVPFSVTIGIVDAANSPVNATAPIDVKVSRALGSLAGVDGGGCTISVGADRCTATGLRAYPIRLSAPLMPPQTNYAAALRVAANGFVPVDTVSFNTAAAPTTTVISAISSGPYLALTEMYYEVTVTTALPSGIVDVPIAPTGCTALADKTVVARYRCANVLTAPATTLSFTFTGGTGAYLPSSANATISTQRVPLDIRLAASNPTVVKAGEPFSLKAWFLLPNGFDVWPTMTDGVLTDSSGSVLCSGMPVSSNSGNTPTSPHGCAPRVTRSGAQPLTISVSQTAQVAFSSKSVPLSVVPAAGISGALYVSTGSPTPTICATSEGLSCTFFRPSDNNVTFSCDAPQGWQGAVYIQQPNMRFGENGRLFGPLTAIEPNYFVPYSIPTTACSVDINEDGLVDIAGDGSFILKSLFGLARSADYASLGHVCARQSFAGAQSKIAAATSNLDWDVDGDGEVHPLTDGLLILRMMLGIWGDALAHGAISPTATRREGNQIANYFYSRCGSPQP